MLKSIRPGLERPGPKMSCDGDDLNLSAQTKPRQGESRREKDPDYREVVVNLSPETRVIVCREGLQWVLQRRTGTPARARWVPLGHFRSRDPLIALGRASEPRCCPDALAVLRRLPANFGQRSAAS